MKTPDTETGKTERENVAHFILTNLHFSWILPLALAKSHVNHSLVFHFLTQRK